MIKARTVLPTDLVALVSFDGRVYPNEAKTWDRLSSDSGRGGPHPLETALEQWFSFATGKHAWISVRGATIRGLVSARPRARSSAWEVDCLIDADEDKTVCLNLLERMMQDVARIGAERIFLRLSADSLLSQVVCQAGFFHYKRERLYRLDKPVAMSMPDFPMRSRSKADWLALYHLYTATTPANVRSIEGATLGQWQAVQEPWCGRPKDLVADGDGSATAWLRVLDQGEKGCFTLMIHPRHLRKVDTLIRAALARLTERHPVFCLIPSYSEAIAPSLESHSFTAIDDYVILAKRLLRPIQELAPQRLRTAVPVN